MHYLEPLVVDNKQPLEEADDFYLNFIITFDQIIKEFISTFIITS